MRLSQIRALAVAAAVIFVGDAAAWVTIGGPSDTAVTISAGAEPPPSDNVVYAPRGTDAPSAGPSATPVDSAHPYVFVTGSFEAKKDAGISFLLSNPSPTNASVVIQVFTATTQVGSNFTVNVQARNTLTAILFATSTGLHFGQLSSSHNDLAVQYRYTDSASVTHFVDTGDVRGPIAAGYKLVPMSPFRVCDTRSGRGTPCSGSPLTAGEVRSIDVAGVGGIPSVGVRAVAVNTTAVQPTATGWLTFYPSGTTRPTAANLNFVPGETVGNFAIVAVAADGTYNVYNSAGTTQIVVDVAGYFV